MKKVLPIALFVSVALLFSQHTFAQHQLSKLWQTDSVLKVPESVLFDGEHKLLYISNIDGDASAKDGKGSVGKLGIDGKIIKIDWVSGLDAPKGLGLYKGKLYVADVNNVVVIDVAKEAIIKKIPIEGAKFLNDITVDANGNVYVSDSQTGKVHVLQNDNASVFHEGFKRPNGLLSVGDDLYVLASGEMFKMSKTTKAMTKIAEGMEASTDGIEQVSDGEFIVSTWIGVIYYIKKDGSKEQLLDTRPEKSNTADIGYDAKNKIIYVPTFLKKSVAAYQLK
jgi:DNA-binding beta-propeller fold protein YncE